MIGKVIRGGNVRGLVNYLMGPGRANEHADQRVLAAWDGRDWTPQPERLAVAMETPVDALGERPDKWVWHCPLRTSPEDRDLSPAEWVEVARDVMDRTGIAPHGDDGAARWAVVQHGPDHVHLFATLARQDGGGRIHPRNDYYRVGEACRAAEQRLALVATAPRDRTANKRPKRAEVERAAREGKAVPDRVWLREQVRAAHASSASRDEFAGRLRAAGVDVAFRESAVNAGQITGYSVARGADGIRYGGSKLGAGLSLPKLERSWAEIGPAQGSGWDALTAAAERVADDPTPDGAEALGEALHAAAARSPELQEMANEMDRARFEPWQRAPVRTPAGAEMRGAARSMRRARPKVPAAASTAIAAAGVAVMAMRKAEQRRHQAEAAERALQQQRQNDEPGQGWEPQQQRNRNRGRSR